MRFSHFFIDRPIFATVLSILIVLLGGAAYLHAAGRAVSRRSRRRRSTVRASYPGASAEVVSDTVATPIEQEINGVEDMLYMTSQATGDGQLVDHRHLRARHRSRYRAGAGAEPRRGRRAAAAGGGAPDRRHGAQVLAGPADGHPSAARPTARATRSTSPTTRRCRCATCWRGSTASATSASSARATMRCASGSTRRRSPSRNLTAGEIVAALRAQNVQVASGVLEPAAGAATQGAFQLNVETLGRLSDPRQFGNIVVKTDADGRVTRVEDIARVELARAGLHAPTAISTSAGGAAPGLPAARLERAGRPPTG